MFPVLAEMPDGIEPESTDDFQTNAAGGFTYRLTAKSKDRPLSDQLVCRGHSTTRTIESVELNGVAKRPQPPEIWKY